MSNVSKECYGIADFVAGDLPERWRSRRDQISVLLQQVGLSIDQHSQCISIFPKRTNDAVKTLDELRRLVDKQEPWAAITGTSGDPATPITIAFPTKSPTPTPQKAVLALYIDIHSRLISWRLINAWRSQQLAQAVWTLGDSMHTIPAAACARSLLETAAAFWVDTRKLRETWCQVKEDSVKNNPQLKHWHELSLQIGKMMWAAKFDKKVPDLVEQFQLWERTNVLTTINKLARATDPTVQSDYQWLCNAVHPSIGGLLAFASPMLVHKSQMYAFQTIAPFPISILYSRNPDKRIVEETIEVALVRAATLAVDVLTRTLDDALKIIDDVALTSGAPQVASFSYWRKIAQKGQNSLCPCRSGRKVRHCQHRWSDTPPEVVERFGISDEGEQ